MDLPLNLSSGTSTFNTFILQRIFVCQEDTMRLRHEIDGLQGRLWEEDNNLAKIKAVIKRSDEKLSECNRNKWDMTRKCTKIKKDLEKTLGAQEIQKLTGTFESLMIDNKDPGEQSTDTVAKVEHVQKNLEDTGMNLELPELEEPVNVKELPERRRSYAEVVKYGKMLQRK